MGPLAVSGNVSKWSLPNRGHFCPYPVKHLAAVARTRQMMTAVRRTPGRRVQNDMQV